MSVAWLASALFTYLAHGLVWAALGVCCGRLAKASPHWQHACYKMGFLGPFLSVTWALAMPAEAAPGAAAARTLWSGGVAPVLNDAWWLVAGKALGALVVVGALRFVLVAWRRWACLRGRAAVTERVALRLLERVRVRSTLRDARLTSSPRLRSPLVVGRTEVCVPCWLTDALGQKQLAAVFAHELSHLERGDGFWFAFVGFVESCFWFHPVMLLLGARFRASAELACDERALSLGADARALAEALVRVAERGISPGERHATPWPAMARSRDDVARRIERLLRRQQIVGAFPAALALPLLLALGLVQSGYGVHVRGLPPQTPPPRVTAVELSALSREMVVLEREQARVARELDVASTTAPSAQESPRVLELEQELRHLLQQRSYVEERAAAGVR